jgi:hypothetical protein
MADFTHVIRGGQRRSGPMNVGQNNRTESAISYAEGITKWQSQTVASWW